MTKRFLQLFAGVFVSVLFVTCWGAGTTNVVTGVTPRWVTNYVSNLFQTNLVGGGYINNSSTNTNVLDVLHGGTGATNAATARANLGIVAGGGSYLLYQHQEVAGTNGGTFAAGSWVTVPINTEVADQSGNGTITGNNITLDSGTYRFRFAIPVYGVGRVVGRVYNVTDSAVIAYGMSIFSDLDDGNSDQILVIGAGRFTLATSKSIRLEAQCSGGMLNVGFGTAANFGTTENYSILELIKE